MNTQRATCWSLTINNPTSNDEDYIRLARAKGWLVEGQLEKGESGTMHYQLMVKTPQVRFSAVKKAFPRAHVEVARNPNALAAYVHKDQGRVAQLPAQDNKYPSVSKLWDLIIECMTNSEDDKSVRLMFGSPCPYNDERFRPMECFDQAIGKLISRGYYVEHWGVNPQIRAQWKMFWRNILERYYLVPQTDRQTDSASESEVEIPMYETQQNADDDTREAGGLQEAGGAQAVSDEDGESYEESASASDDGTGTSGSEHTGETDSSSWA